MNYWKYYCISSLFFILFTVSSTLHAQPKLPEDTVGLLTTEEQQWLDENQPITVAIDAYFPPFSFVDDTGQSVGIAVETLDLISKKLAFQYQITHKDTWQNIVPALEGSQVDVILTMVDNEQRRSNFAFTKPFIFKSLVIIAHKNNRDVIKRADIKNKTIALVEGYQYSNRILAEFPNVKPYYVSNMLDAMRAVELKQADLAISYFAASAYLQNKYQLSQLKFVDYYDKNSSNESMAVNKDNAILATILQKGLNLLTLDEKQNINIKWGNNIALLKDYQLNLKIVAFTAVILILLLMWIFQVKRHYHRLSVTHAALNESNLSLSLLKDSLEQQINIRTIELSKSEHKYRGLVESLQNEYLFFQNDAKGKITYVSPSVTNILGYSVEEFCVNYQEFLTDSPINIDVPILITRCLQGEKLPSFEIQVRTKDGQIRHLELLIRLVQDDNERIQLCEGIAHDITQLKQTQERLNLLSHYDDLTGLANRRLFLTHLKKAISLANKQKTSLALLFLDLNRFKYVNDNLGHGAGDMVLKQTALRLVQQLREYDTAARLGSDEFCIILPEAGAREAEITALRILESMQLPFDINGQTFELGASIGISLYPDDGKNAEILLKQADSAMSMAKKSINHYAFCSLEQMKLNQRRIQLEQGLRHDLSASNINCANFSAVYQAINTLPDATYNGFEALIRWQHPTLGAISPVEFIQIAEETGLINHISRWMIKQVCLQCVDWHQRGFKFGRVSINISAYELISNDLANEILALISECQAKPEWLKIEVTETALMQAPDLAIKTLTTLVDAGIKVAIDDFGTGYSSLTYLKHLPAHFIKIDQSFIKNLNESSADQALIKSIIHLSHSLNKKVIAEGVETQAQLDFLITHGCDNAQGYLFSKPINPQAVLEKYHQEDYTP